MSPSSAASLGSGSVREMPSTTSHANSIWTDLHSVASLTAGASSRVELLDSLRDDEMSCVSMQRAYKDKISKRKRHVNHVDMRKMTGRSSAPKAITWQLDYEPLWSKTRPRTASVVHTEYKRTASRRIGAVSLDTPERHSINVSPWLDTLRADGQPPPGSKSRLFASRPNTAPDGRPRTAPVGSSSDATRADLSALSTKRRNQNFVKMKRQTQRPDINPKYAYGHIAHNPTFTLTERSTLHTSHVHAKAAPRFAGSATGTTNAYWLSNAGVATINQARNGVQPAIIRPNYTPIRRRR